MYLVRFGYDIKPSDRNEVIKLIRKEVEAARAKGFPARLLVPLTRSRRGAALEYELEVPRLDILEEFRENAIEADESATHQWMRTFSHLLQSPPTVTIYRMADSHGQSGKGTE